ncbi:MAG: hypothetical protein ABH878_00610, partial [bacterium]
MNKFNSGKASVKSRWLFIIIILCLLSWCIAWLIAYEPEHDEVEHWHVAWLMEQGQQPFKDFFEHHSPLLWNFLRIHYIIAGENFAIIPVSRALMIVIFGLTLYFAYRIARHWTSPEGSWIATVGFPAFSLSLLLAHLFVRGDPIILLFIMAALWLTVSLVEKKEWSRREFVRLFGIFFCLGVAFGLSPRAGIPSLTLFLILAFFGFRILSFFRTFITFFAGGIIVLLPTLLLAIYYGFNEYIFWV